jgi:hypothetical protein
LHRFKSVGTVVSGTTDFPIQLQRKWIINPLSMPDFQAPCSYSIEQVEADDLEEKMGASVNVST